MKIAARIDTTIGEWLQRSSHNYTSVEVAFYGGSFTCLPLDRQRLMLEAVADYITRGEVQSIRLSTRPDCLDGKICEFLKEHGVRLVELGVQSFDDRVLQRSQRGHSSDDCHHGVSLIKKAGMDVGIQLMVGLPGETTRTFFQSVRETIRLNPKQVRLYPVLVVEGSGLAEYYQRGAYHPLSLNKAVVMTARAKELFEGLNIAVVRMGLQPSKSLEDGLLAGPYHPAFGELVNSRNWLKRVRKLLVGVKGDKRVEIHISKKDVSAFMGLKKKNYTRLEELGLLQRMTLVPENEMKRGSMYHVIN